MVADIAGNGEYWWRSEVLHERERWVARGWMTRGCSRTGRRRSCEVREVGRADGELWEEGGEEAVAGGGVGEDGESGGGRECGKGL